jgi:hypothetical protein
MFSVAEGNHMLATNGCVHSRWFHTSERTTYAVSASSYHLDVKSSQLSSPTDVIYTISLASGSSNVVNFQDGSWPTIPAPELVQPYPKAPEINCYGNRCKFQILMTLPENVRIEAEALKHWRWWEGSSNKENVPENHSFKMTWIQAARTSMQTSICIAKLTPCLCEVLKKMVTK